MSKWKRFLITLAVGIGTGVFIAWKVATHWKNLKDAQAFVTADPRDIPGKAQVMQDLGVAGKTFEEKAQSLREEVEAQTKEEIIYAFKKAFGVAPDPGNGTYSGDVHD